MCVSVYIYICGSWDRLQLNLVTLSFFSPFTFGQRMDPHFDMGEIPTANLSANFVEADPPADCQLTDNPVITSHSSTFSSLNSSAIIKT